MNLSLLIILPLAFAIVALFVNEKQVRAVALLASAVQLLLSVYLGLRFMQERAVDNTEFLFRQNMEWFPSLVIGYHVGVDGI